MITIVNYGLGNIKAFSNIYKRLNIPCKIVETPEELMSATKIILPGVGAFDHAMEALEKSGMRSTLDYLVLEKSIPVLGICIGMHILAQSSDEGNLPGLGWIDGAVKKISASKLNSIEPLPHMGWNNINKINNCDLLKDLPQNSYFYFLHSYYFQCNNPENIVTTTYYGDKFSSIIKSNNIYGIQCHPEKSHQNGIILLKNFGNL